MINWTKLLSSNLACNHSLMIEQIGSSVVNHSYVRPYWTTLSPIAIIYAH